MQRTIRRLIEIGLPVVGTLVVFAAILLMPGQTTVQMGMAAGGVVMIQAGIWRLAHPLLPSERKYEGLRREVDYFILLVRRLNAAALGVKEVDNEATRSAFNATQDKMRESFERMALLAGKTDEEAEDLQVLTPKP